MTICDFLETEFISINARRCIVRSLDDECNATVWFDDEVCEGDELRDAGHDEDYGTYDWYDVYPITWVQIEDDALVFDVDEEVG